MERGPRVRRSGAPWTGGDLTEKNLPLEICTGTAASPEVPVASRVLKATHEGSCKKVHLRLGAPQLKAPALQI